LSAGLLTWLFVQTLHPVFWTDVGRDEVGFLPVAVQWRLDRNNTMLVLALMGGLTGIAIAISECAGRASSKLILIAAARCGATGALFGALAGYLGHRTFEFYRANAEVSDLSKAILFNGIMLATMGGGVGFGAGIFVWQSPRAASEGFVRGMLAGVLAGFTYLLVAALFLPGAMTTVLLPQEVVTRILWFGLATGFVGAMVSGPLTRLPARPSQNDP
jgi:hypothetical protein